MDLNRRQFIAGAAVTVAGTLGLRAVGVAAATTSPAALPPPEQSGIDHIVVVMMENRSFDHYLGWLPGADGKQDGLSYVDNNGKRHATHHLDTFTGCGHPDPDHPYQGGRVQYSGGACDGFLQFLGDGTVGTSGDDHPLADIRVGQHFLNTVYNAVVSGPNWERTVLVINYDEWGGFFDHVPPTTAPDPRPDLGTGLRGFRVPCLVISPRARRQTIAHGTYDHTSVLKMIEWRFGLEPLTVRDAGANNLAEVLDFEAKPDLTAARYNVPDIQACGCRFAGHAAGDIHAGHDWPALRDYATCIGY